MRTIPRLRILLVEDHQETLQTYRRVLGRQGHWIVAVADTSAALEAAGGHPFDLLICDLTRPEDARWNLLARLRRVIPGLAGIAVCGHGRVERSRDAGYLELCKPTDPIALYDAILRCAQVLQES